MKKFMTATFATAVLLSGAVATSASAVTFTDRATFLAQSGTVTEHTDLSADFTISNGPNASVIVTDTTTFTDKFSPNKYIVISDVENFNAVVTFSADILAFGMDVFEPTSTAKFNGCNVSACVESTFELSFLSGATLLETISFEPANDVLAFIGFSSATAFNRIEVREVTGSNDNEMFGNFATVTAAVPVPAALPLMAAGIGAFGLMGWRRKRAAA